MMKKLALILGGGLTLALLFFAGAGLWIKSNLQEIAQEITGTDLRFASVGLSYAPIPAIVLTDLSVTKGENTVKVPQLKLYPDLTKIFSGQISVRKAVLEEPLVVAAQFGTESQRAAPPEIEGSSDVRLSMETIPNVEVVVNRGKLVVQASHGQALPIAVTAKAKKTDQRIAVQVNRASIDEIGLKFTGQVGIDSFAPLKISIKATQGTFNPTAIKDFLRKFGYISEADANRLPPIQQMGAKGLKLDFDAASGRVALAAETLGIDQVALRDVAVNLADGSFQIRCTNGVVDAQNIYGWLLENADTKKMMEDLLARAKLKLVTPQGAIKIASLQFQGSNSEAEGRQTLGPIDGAVDLSIQGLTLRLVGDNGQEQQLTVSQLESKVTVEKGKPTVTVDRLTFNSSRGGTGSITGTIPFPLSFHRATLKSAIKGFKFFDTTLDFQLSKGDSSKTAFKMGLRAPALNVSADGLVYIPGRKKTDLEARLINLRIASMQTADRSQSEQNASLSKLFNTKAIAANDFSAGAFVKTFQIEGLPKLQDVDLHFKSGGHRIELQGSVRMCDVDLGIEAVGLPSDRIAATLETKGTDIDLSSLIACFSKELPVYLSGRVYLNGSFGTSGVTPQQLMDGVEGEVTVVMSRAAVRRLSGLDPRLGFILDILRTAGIRADQIDTVELSRAVVNANLNRGRVVMDRFTLVGPLISAWGAGEFTLADKHLVLSGSVKTAMGVQRRLDIDRILQKEGT
jgi:hypothetical protein